MCMLETLSESSASAVCVPNYRAVFWSLDDHFLKVWRHRKIIASNSFPHGTRWFLSLCVLWSVTDVQLSCSRWKANRSNIWTDEQDCILLGFWLPLQNTIALKVSMIRIYCHSSGVGTSDLDTHQDSLPGTPWWALDSSFYVVPSYDLPLPYSFWLIIPKGYTLVVITKSQTERISASVLGEKQTFNPLIGFL